jgi:ATP-dependent DNA helicase DinG
VSLPLPRVLQLPHEGWRPHQQEAIWSLVDSPFRFSGLVAPTGSGKSSTALAVARLMRLQAAVPKDHRVVVLTSTRALQDQYSSYGKLADVRGQSHYVCVAEPRLRVSEGFCHLGPRCELRDGGCHYYDAIGTAKAAPITVTNYSWWLAHSLYSEEYPAPALLVLDEAHAADQDLSEALSVTITKDELHHLLRDEIPGKDWPSWAEHHKNEVGGAWDDIRSQGTDLAAADRRRAFKLRDLHRKLTRLAATKETEGWVMEHTPKSLRFDVAWPGPYAEELLFRGSPRVVLMSAVLRHKTMQLLGLKKGGYDLHEWPSSFPVDRRPVRVVPTVRLRWDSDPALLTLWIARLDQIIDRRLDRKGVLHTVSYRRRDEIMARSRHRSIMVTHGPGELDSCIKRFKSAPAPCLLVSPAVTTGVDFPYSECEYSVVCKVPFPDSRSRILKARQAADREYGLYLAAMEIVQAAGRGMRAADDRHEVLIIDDQVRWVLSKYEHLFPRWFLDAVHWESGVPSPPPKLRGQTCQTK